MRISNLFPEKELTEHEIKVREARKEFKKLKRKFYKNPLKVSEFMQKGFDMLDKWEKDGVITTKEKEKEKKQITKDMEKANKIIDKLRR